MCVKVVDPTVVVEVYVNFVHIRSYCHYRANGSDRHLDRWYVYVKRYARSVFVSFAGHSLRSFS
jgi:hypothetical protein